MSDQAMTALLQSFIPRIKYADALERHLVSGDAEASVACAMSLMQLWFTPPSGMDRLRYAHGEFLGPVKAQYIVMEELIISVMQLQATQTSSVVASVLSAPQSRHLHLVDGLDAA